MHPDDLDGEQGVEEVLVLRVVTEAQRRRVRRALIGGLLLVVTAGGVAVGLTHRSGAASTALPTAQRDSLSGQSPDVQLPGVGAPDVARAAIYSAAREWYPSVKDTERRTTLQFGSLRISGDRATLAVNFVCVPLCGHGEVLTLAVRHGRWTVIAHRQAWVS